MTCIIKCIIRTEWGCASPYRVQLSFVSFFSVRFQGPFKGSGGLFPRCLLTIYKRIWLTWFTDEINNFGIANLNEWRQIKTIAIYKRIWLTWFTVEINNFEIANLNELRQFKNNSSVNPSERCFNNSPISCDKVFWNLRQLALRFQIFITTESVATRNLKCVTTRVYLVQN